MRKTIITEEIIEKAKLLHNNKYDYIHMKYKRLRDKIKIICPIHGEFSQQLHSHLQGTGCPKCGICSAGALHVANLEKVKIDLYKLFPNLSIIEYNGLSKRSIIKDNLSILYKVVLSQVLRNNYPTIQSAIDKNNAFEKRAKNIHGDKYEYSKVEYIHTQIPITITCKQCGDFIQTPNSHLNGTGCPICNRQRGYSKSDWTNYCTKNNILECCLYVIKCYNDNEEFIKIGITTKTIFERFQFPRDMPYKYKILEEFIDSPKNIYEKEKYLHSLYKEFRHKPLLDFIGKTECFTIDCLELF